MPASHRARRSPQNSLSLPRCFGGPLCPFAINLHLTLSCYITNLFSAFPPQRPVYIPFHSCLKEGKPFFFSFDEHFFAFLLENFCVLLIEHSLFARVQCSTPFIFSHLGFFSFKNTKIFTRFCYFCCKCFLLAFSLATLTFFCLSGSIDFFQQRQQHFFNERNTKTKIARIVHATTEVAATRRHTPTHL